MTDINHSPDSKRKDNGRTILIIIIIFLLIVVGFLVVNNLEKSDRIIRKSEMLQQDSLYLSLKTRELEELILAYERVRMEREELGLSRDSLEKQLIHLKRYLEEIKKGNSKAIAGLNKLIEKYKPELDIKDKEISLLKLRNDSLYKTIGSLNIEKARMDDSLLALRGAKANLQLRLAQASMLKAENIKINAINNKGKELSKDEYKAKNISKLKVTFSLAENRVAKKEKKEIMLRVIQPDGTALIDMASGGGFFVSEGKEIPYTSRQVINFTNTKQQVVFIYLKGSNYLSGQYKAEIYAESYKIGDTSFLIK